LAALLKLVPLARRPRRGLHTSATKHLFIASCRKPGQCRGSPSLVSIRLGLPDLPGPPRIGRFRIIERPYASLSRLHRRRYAPARFAKPARERPARLERAANAHAPRGFRAQLRRVAQNGTDRRDCRTEKSLALKRFDSIRFQTLRTRPRSRTAPARPPCRC
jgi:hypothetical protein